MSAFSEQSIEELMVEYHKQIEQLNENRRKIQEATGTATSQRQSVKVTVNGKGELVELKFPTDSYKKMAPIELANIIVETFTKAREQVAEEVAEVVSAMAPEGFDLSHMFGPDADLSKVLPNELIMPDAVREYVNNGRNNDTATQ